MLHLSIKYNRAALVSRGKDRAPLRLVFSKSTPNCVYIAFHCAGKHDSNERWFVNQSRAIPATGEIKICRVQEKKVTVEFDVTNKTAVCLDHHLRKPTDIQTSYDQLQYYLQQLAYAEWASEFDEGRYADLARAAIDALGDAPLNYGAPLKQIREEIDRKDYGRAMILFDHYFIKFVSRSSKSRPSTPGHDALAA